MSFFDSVSGIKMKKIDSFRATIIVAVYKDTEALRCVLWGLEQQTEKSFEILITEDGEDTDVAEFLRQWSKSQLNIRHLTQSDIGFRKTRAVNRAVASAKADYLIFLDGDCIPHPTFVEAHLKDAEKGFFLAGRRMHLGSSWSAMIRRNPESAVQLFTKYGIWKNIISLHVDGVRNYEIGHPCAVLHSILRRKYVSLIGCNFSVWKADFYKINGYDEDLTGIGGEDEDLEWRLNEVKIKSKSVKYLAIVFHLFHESRRENSAYNQALSKKNREINRFFSEKGLRQHLQ